MQDIQRVEGWALNRIAALDLHAAGLAGSFLRASAERRQVIAALLSVTPPPSAADDAKRPAEFIASADHRSILLQAFGSVPMGFRGALARCGHQPHAQGFYRLLHQTLEREDKTAQVIRRVMKINPNRLRIAKLLPEEARTVSLVSIVASPSMARDVGTMITLLEGNFSPCTQTV